MKSNHTNLEAKLFSSFKNIDISDISQTIETLSNDDQKQSSLGKRKRNQKKKKFQNDNEDSIQEEEKNVIKKINGVPLEVIEIIKEITDNFELTFKHIAQDIRLLESPLNNYDQEEIQEIIRIQKQKKKRQIISLQKITNQKSNKNKQSLSKEILNQVSDDELGEPYKRFKVDDNNKSQSIESQFKSFAKLLIQDFENLDAVSSKKVLEVISQLIKDDQTILKRCIMSQSKQSLKLCQELFQERNFPEIEKAFTAISPMAAILVNFEISRSQTNIIDEAIFLSKTLLPYINECISYDFIPEDYNVQASRCAHTLIQYFQDSNFQFQKGFASFCLEFVPQVLQKIIKNDENKKVLCKAFIDQGYSKEDSEAMAEYSQKFLWPELQNALLKLDQEERSNLVGLIQRLVVITDPGTIITELRSKLGKRQIFLGLLQRHEVINMTINKLIEILDSISGMETKAIQECLRKDPNSWGQVTKIAIERQDNSTSQLSEDQIQNFYKERTQSIKCDKIVTLDNIVSCSKEVSQECKNYSHCLYQCAVAAIALSQDKLVRVVEMPTGSGKTWLYGLIAKYYLNQKKKVTIIEPNQTLCAQTTEMLGYLDYDLTITTIDQFYQTTCKDEILIVDEYHHIVQNSGFSISNNFISGIWNMKNKIVYFCTATTNKGLEKILHCLVETPVVLKFSSEYELIHKVSPLEAAEIKTCQSKEQKLLAIEDDIKLNYDETPIIVITSSNEKQQVIDMINKNGWQKMKVGTDCEILKEVRSWTYGILIIEENEGFGINTRFATDSLVLISCQVQTKAEYQQFLGRSSRTRGLCKGIYYAVTTASKTQVLENLNASYLYQLEELRKLLLLLSMKKSNQNLVEAIETTIQSGEKIKSLKDIQTIVGSKEYSKLTRGFDV